MCVFLREAPPTRSMGPRKRVRNAFRVRVGKEDAVHPSDRFAIDSVTLESLVAPGFGGVHPACGAIPALTVHIHGHLRACFAVGIEADEDGVGAVEAHSVDGGLDEGAEAIFVSVVVGDEGGVFLARADVDHGLDVDSDDKEASECQSSTHGRGAAANVYGAASVEGWGAHMTRRSKNGVVKRGRDGVGPGAMEG